LDPAPAREVNGNPVSAAGGVQPLRILWFALALALLALIGLVAWSRA
jgi:hypothetical protein